MIKKKTKSTMKNFFCSIPAVIAGGLSRSVRHIVDCGELVLHTFLNILPKSKTIFSKEDIQLYFMLVNIFFNEAVSLLIWMLAVLVLFSEVDFLIVHDLGNTCLSLCMLINCKNVIKEPRIAHALTPLVDVYKIAKRFMPRGTSPSFARSAFYIMETLFKEDLAQHIRNNRQHLAEKLVDLSLDHDKGIMQDKNILLGRMLTNQFDPVEIYKYYKIKTGIEINCASSNIEKVDTRIFPELPTLEEYYRNFGPYILGTTANLDSVTMQGPGIKQPCPDFTVNARVPYVISTENKLIPYIGGVASKVLIHDEKSAGGMFAHSTSGSMGIVPYDNEGKVLVSNNSVYMINDILTHDKRNLNAIRLGISHDNLSQNTFNSIFEESAKILLNRDNKSSTLVHEDYQHHMWKNLQLHPEYNRTLSYIFPKEMTFTPLKDHGLAFKSRFCELLKDRNYDINKQGDYQEVCRAMFRAYKETCNIKLPPLLEYYIYSKQEDIRFNKRFLNELVNIIKNDPWFQS